MNSNPVILLAITAFFSTSIKFCLQPICVQISEAFLQCCNRWLYQIGSNKMNIMTCLLGFPHNAAATANKTTFSFTTLCSSVIFSHVSSTLRQQLFPYIPTSILLNNLLGGGDAVSLGVCLTTQTSVHEKFTVLSRRMMCTSKCNKPNVCICYFLVDKGVRFHPNISFCFFSRNLKRRIEGASTNWRL